MKLLFCPLCGDVRALRCEECKCSCGESRGKMLDEIRGEYSGCAVPLGINNSTLSAALGQWLTYRGNHEITAFTIPTTAPTINMTGVF